MFLVKIWNTIFSIFLFSSMLIGCSTSEKSRPKNQIWYKLAGLESGQPVFYLHGGPGYNSYVFEKSVGYKMEKKLRMVYIDQRSGGRSAISFSDDAAAMDQVVIDIEKIRIKLGFSKINLIGHSFGGLVALEYLKKHGKRVDKIILVEISNRLSSVFEYQIRHAHSVASKKWPKKADQLKSLISSEKIPWSEKLDKAYELVGRLPLQRQLMFSSPRQQLQMEKLDNESGLLKKSTGEFGNKLRKEGYFDSNHKEFSIAINTKAILFASKKSHTVGIKNINAAAKAWDVPISWFNNSGHFVYFEEPDLFSKRAIKFITHRNVLP